MTGTNRSSLVIQERDRHLLRELAVMRVIDRDQAKRVAGFGSTTQVNARLLRLTQAGLLRRFFLGTNAGGQKAIYALSLAGAKLVNVPFRGPRRRNDEVIVADFFVAHQFAINEIYGDLKYRPIPIAEAKFEKWVSFYEPVGQGMRLIPDGYFELYTPQKMLCAFVEVDLGNEGLSVWKRKVESYVHYAISGAYEKQFGQHQFRVLVIAKTERRMRSLQAAILTLTDKIFWFSTLDSIAHAGFWSPVWLRARNGERQPLL
jgi:Replication-relaxation